MIRIVAGDLRGRRLEVDPRIRPTMERARKAVFDILGESVIGAIVLDAAAGSGAYGIEALSRGASRAEFIEPDPRVRTILLGNLARLGLADRSLVHGSTIAGFVARKNAARYDIVFHDPPYGDAEVSVRDLEGLLRFLSPEGFLFHERGDDVEPAPSGCLPADRRRYGTTRFLIYRG